MKNTLIMNKIIFVFSFLILACFSLNIHAQVIDGTISVEVKGTVYDEANVPVIGATVVIENQPGVGTATDIDGKFSLKAPMGSTLLFTYVGYLPQKYLVAQRPKGEIEIILKVNTEQLEEITVTGLGSTQRRISIVGAVTSVDAKQLQAPATSINNMLAGRVPGIISQQLSGEPGKNIAEFWVRGIGTFGANKSALVLVDGIEGSLNNLDPADIENIEILKDASATAVYGVRGANGVVLVTTKRGTAEKLEITARVNYTVSQLTNMPEYLDAYEYAKLANEARAVRGMATLYNPTDLHIIRDGLDPELFPNVNWRDEILNKTSFQQTYYLSARGGSNVAKYFLSLGASDEGSAYKQDKNSKYAQGVGYKKYTYRANIDMNLTKTTSLYFGVDGWITNQVQPGGVDTDLLWDAQASLTPLSMPTRFSSGELPARDSSFDYSISPYVLLNYTGKKKTDSSNNILTLALSQDLGFITKGLKVRAQGAITRWTTKYHQRTLRPALYSAQGRSAAGDLQLIRRFEAQDVSNTKGQDQSVKYHFESTLNYERLFGGDHRTSALVYYYMNSYQKVSDIQTGASATATLSAIPRKYQGISSRITYGFKDTYMVDFNFGYTGSENFKPGKQFGFFPSIAGGWIPTNYEFMREKLPWFSFLKIRGSYGIVGSDEITSRRFPYLTMLKTGGATGWGFNGGGIHEELLGADNLEWEKSKKMDIGIEAKFLKDKLEIVADYFQDTRDGIFQERAQIPSFVGLATLPYGNVGKMKSWGSDGNISFSHNLNKDMSFVVRANYTYVKDDVKAWERATPKYQYQEYHGWPLQVQRGYVALGLFRDQEDVDNSPTQFDTKLYPGDIKYKDVNGDGKIDSDDEVPLAYPDRPRLTYGFGGEFSYKNFTFSFLFKGIGRKDFFYTARGGMGYIPFVDGSSGNVLKIAADQSNRWIPAEYSGDSSTENPNARFPRLSYGSNANNNKNSTFWLANGQYLRLQEVNLSYRLKTPFLRKIGVSSLDLQLIGQDLYVWDKIGGLYDPEQSSKNGRAYPIPRRFTFQLYINI